MTEEDEDSERTAYGGKRRLVKVGGSVMITVPKEWLKQHGYEPGGEVPFLANRDFVLLSPQSNREAYQTATEIVEKSREEAENANRE